MHIIFIKIKQVSFSEKLQLTQNKKNKSFTINIKSFDCNAK